MRQVDRSALLPYSAEQMFELVNDVSAYPAFLPWCNASRIISVEPDVLVAELTVARSGITQSFTTRNLLYRPERIELQLVDGPFKKLSGSWDFRSLGQDGCRVEMQLSFEVDSRLAGVLLERVFEQATSSLVDAFCQRADELYDRTD